MTKEEHLVWCKERALEYLVKGEIWNAVTSMLSDLGKHPETKVTNLWVEAIGYKYAQEYNYKRLKEWIEGFK